MAETVEQRLGKLEEEVRQIRLALAGPPASPEAFGALTRRVARLEERLREDEQT